MVIRYLGGSICAERTAIVKAVVSSYIVSNIYQNL